MKQNQQDIGTQDNFEEILKLRRELEQVIIKVNYHYQSGYERHVILQTKESIFLNFLKKMITVIPSAYMYRVNKTDFTIEMEDNFVTSLTFQPKSRRYEWQQLDTRLEMLCEAIKDIDFDDLATKSHTLDKWYQQTDKIINSIKDFQF